MPTILTHAIVGGTIAQVSPRTSTRRWTIAAAVCAALPDLDVVSFRLGVPYASMLGHRGITHSLFAACLISTVAQWATSSRAGRDATRLAFPGLALFAATTSHGLLDALTNGGLGVAFFAPFTGARFFFPWRPIAVSPIGAAFFFSRGLAVLASEFVWVWLPTLVLLAYLRRTTRQTRTTRPT